MHRRIPTAIVRSVGARRNIHRASQAIERFKVGSQEVSGRSGLHVDKRDDVRTAPRRKSAPAPTAGRRKTIGGTTAARSATAATSKAQRRKSAPAQASNAKVVLRRKSILSASTGTAGAGKRKQSQTSQSPQKKSAPETKSKKRYSVVSALKLPKGSRPSQKMQKNQDQVEDDDDAASLSSLESTDDDVVLVPATKRKRGASAASTAVAKGKESQAIKKLHQELERTRARLAEATRASPQIGNGGEEGPYGVVAYVDALKDELASEKKKRQALEHQLRLAAPTSTSVSPAPLPYGSPINRSTQPSQKLHRTESGLISPESSAGRSDLPLEMEFNEDGGGLEVDYGDDDAMGGLQTDFDDAGPAPVSTAPEPTGQASTSQAQPTQRSTRSSVRAVSEINVDDLGPMFDEHDLSQSQRPSSGERDEDGGLDLPMNDDVSAFAEAFRESATPQVGTTASAVPGTPHDDAVSQALQRITSLIIEVVEADDPTSTTVYASHSAEPTAASLIAAIKRAADEVNVAKMWKRWADERNWPEVEVGKEAWTAIQGEVQELKQAVKHKEDKMEE